MGEPFPVSCWDDSTVLTVFPTLRIWGPRGQKEQVCWSSKMISRVPGKPLGPTISPPDFNPLHFLGRAIRQRSPSRIEYDIMSLFPKLPTLSHIFQEVSFLSPTHWMVAGRPSPPELLIQGAVCTSAQPYYPCLHLAALPHTCLLFICTSFLPLIMEGTLIMFRLSF